MQPAGGDKEFLADAEQLLAAARKGSSEALGQLLDQCRRYLLAVANREMPADLKTKAGPSDLVQDSLAEGLQQFVHFTGNTGEDLRHWLTAILRNKLGNFRQSFQRAKRQASREVSLDAGIPGAAPALVDDLPSPSSVVGCQEQADALLRALCRLPEVYRQVIYWRNWEKQPFAEIGRRLNRSEDAARMVWARAIDQLGQVMVSPPPPT